MDSFKDIKIVIDGRMYSESGVGRYIRNLIKWLQKLDKKNQYYILLTKDNFDKVYFENNFKKILVDVRWYSLREQIIIPKILHDLKPDLVHFPHFNVPLLYGGKFVVTIHDLIHQHFQMRRATTKDPLTYEIKQFGYTWVFKKAINNASKILVPSNYVKELLVKKWKLDEDKIVVTYEAVDDKIFSVEKIMKGKRIDQVMNKYNIKQPYIFYVGNAHPHKNLEGLIKTFLKLREKYPSSQLVLSGSDHYFWQRIKREYQYKNIIYTGFISDKELVALYKNARCFVIPSFEEGFGIPMLEAMACGCPVVSSNAGSLPEVGGNVCIYFDPYNNEDMAEKISQVLDHQDLRMRLTKLGQERVKIFSWEKLAKKTLEEYLQCV